MLDDNPMVDTPLTRICFAIISLSLMVVLLNMFISVFNDAFATVCGDDSLHGFDRDLNDHLWQTINRFFRSCTHSASDQVVVTHTVSFKKPLPDSDIEKGSFMQNGHVPLEEDVTDLLKTIGNCVESF